MINAMILTTVAGLSTVLGSLVPFFKFKDREGVISFSLSFSLAVMIGISVLELAPNSFIKLNNNFNLFLSIIIFILSFLIGYFIIKLLNKKSPLPDNNLYRVGILSMIALMIHNFPEAIATFMSSYNDISEGISLTVAIMMHNIPEGISIAVPIYYATNSKKKGIIYSLISGLSEPLGAIIAYILLKEYINDIVLSIILIIVSGIMITLSINKIYPEAIKYRRYKSIKYGLIVGIIVVLFNKILL